MKLETQFDMFIALKKDTRCKLQDTRSGFSLTELVLYLAMIGALTSVVIGMFVSFTRLQIKAESQTELAQNARSAVERLRQEIVKAASVNTPASSGAQGTNLYLVMSSTWTCFRINANILEMSEGGSGACDTNWSPLTSTKVNITNSDIFTRIDNTSAKSTIQIKLTFIYNSRPEYTYTTQTTAGLR